MARKIRIFKTLLRIANSQSGDDCFGTIIDTSHNWFEDNSGGRTGDGDPNLGFLRNNGGPTHTHALLVDSGAIDKGDDAVCAAAPVYNLDQCGIARLIGDHCDIGAYAYRDDSNFFCTTRKKWHCGSDSLVKNNGGGYVDNLITRGSQLDPGYECL